MVKMRLSTDRGHADHRWLKTYHSFSFAEYFDPAHMNYRTLRVMNEDWITAGQGFSPHPHRDMEILTYMVEGELEHKDSMGNGQRIRAGQLQAMSAGTGVTHSEFNPTKDQTTHLLQIWVVPNQAGLTPHYAEWTPKPEDEGKSMVVMASKDGREGSVTIAQDLYLYRLQLKEKVAIKRKFNPRRFGWLQLIQGQLKFNGQNFGPGDGAAISEEAALEFESEKGCLGLFFDLG